MTFSYSSSFETSKELHIIRNITVTSKATGTVTESATVEVSGGIVTLYAVTANGYLTIEGA